MRSFAWCETWSPCASTMTTEMREIPLPPVSLAQCNAECTPDRLRRRAGRMRHRAGRMRRWTGRMRHPSWRMRNPSWRMGNPSWWMGNRSWRMRNPSWWMRNRSWWMGNRSWWIRNRSWRMRNRSWQKPHRLDAMRRPACRKRRKFDEKSPQGAQFARPWSLLRRNPNNQKPNPCRLRSAGICPAQNGMRRRSRGMASRQPNEP